MSDYGFHQRTTNISMLTPREIEVLELKAQGLKNKEIAGNLFICVKTVEHTWNTVLQVLESRGNSRLAIYKAYQLGLIKPPIEIEKNIVEALADIAEATEILKNSCAKLAGLANLKETIRVNK